MKLVEVHPPAIASRWEWVRAGCEEVRSIGGPTACPWLPEDIYHALHTRAAVLWLIEMDDGTVPGFMVLQASRLTYEQVLFVWVLWATKFSLIRHMHLINAALKNLARESGLCRIRHISNQGAWASTKLFVPVSTIYECEVTQ